MFPPHLLPVLAIVFAVFSASFASAEFMAPTVTLSLEPNEIEQLLNTAGECKNLSDDEQVAAFKVLGEEQGGNLKTSIDNALTKANVTDEEFKRNIESAKAKLSSSKAKETADELEKLFLDGTLSFVDKVKKSVETVRELPAELRSECQPVLQVVDSITRCPFAEQCAPGEEKGLSGELGVGKEEKSKLQQEQLQQKQHPCFHLKLLKVCTITKNIKNST